MRGIDFCVVGGRKSEGGVLAVEKSWVGEMAGLEGEFEGQKGKGLRAN